VSYTSLLIDTCTVQRNTPGAANNYGTPAESWADHLADEPCRIQDAGGKEVQIGAEVVIADYKLFLGDVDITEQDRVIAGGVTYHILLVQDRKDSTASHHKECYLKAVR